MVISMVNTERNLCVKCAMTKSITSFGVGPSCNLLLM